MDAQGRVNLAPYSFFNAVAYDPPQVMFAAAGSHAFGGLKDSVNNIEATGAFVVNLATWDLREAMNEVASRSDLTADDVVMRFGLHWGSTLYMGNITTAARTEVTALGDEVNEAARIEACATGGRILASKPLMERLDEVDAAAVGLEPDHTTYTQLADLATATDKARRDAPAIAVCEL